MKNILFHMSVIFLLFVMVVMNTGETASARSVYKHKIFSKSVVSKRIDTIKQFYYKKSKQLKTKNQTVTLNFEKGKMTYYFHGNDLMFSCGMICFLCLVIWCFVANAGTAGQRFRFSIRLSNWQTGFYTF